MKKNVFLAYLLIITVISTAVSFSKFSTSGQFSDNVRVASPILHYVPQYATLNDNLITDLSDGININDALPGDVLVYRFDILNFNGDKINEVLLKYKITVTFTPSTVVLPLDYTLQPADYYESAGGEWIYMDSGKKTTHSYTLTVTWPSSNNNSDYEGQQQNIGIHIESEQSV
ncbi:MAG: hypothetical protein PHX02_07490 [Oscillospiraceae bacterium]|jgi:hypothetical protein|nr:hypothetical protein [Oscillospiraceae bacterium]